MPSFILFSIVLNITLSNSFTAYFIPSENHAALIELLNLTPFQFNSQMQELIGDLVFIYPLPSPIFPDKYNLVCTPSNMVYLSI